MEKHRTSMTDQFVLDTSVTLAWYFPDQGTDTSDALMHSIIQDAKAFVPQNWILEVTNVVVLAELAKRTTLAKTTAFFEELKKLNIETDKETGDRAPVEIALVARTYKLTSYDAAFLELA